MHCQHENCQKVIRVTASRGPIPKRCPKHTREHRQQLTNARVRKFRAKRRAAKAA